MSVTHTHSSARMSRFVGRLSRFAGSSSRFAGSSSRIAGRCLGVAALVAAFNIGSQAQAGESHRRTPPVEKSELHIFDHVYGGHFTQDGLNFSNNSGITATRVTSPSPWSGQILSAQTEAVFGRHSRGYGLGYVDASGQTTSLFGIKGHGYKVAGSSGLMTPAGDFNLVRTGGGQTLSSDAAANSDGREHLITYAITGLKSNGGAPVNTWLTFWEDKPAHTGWDYNDLVVEMKTKGISAAAVAPAAAAIRSEPLLIPLPTAANTGLAGLLFLAVAAKIQHLRRRHA
ncbi:MAG: hypothetical protein JWL69_1345 [Phycisphaerales bacterium]|nr:hypothetical protein [Phycisphaerales bacterium]MDB5357205.1 hypothetical protein [Phycisphaerales bacterium]